jgi:MFS family permease
MAFFHAGAGRHHPQHGDCRAIARSLERSPLAMQSAVISYTLTVAMLIPVSGWVADRFGTRRVFIFRGFAVFSRVAARVRFLAHRRCVVVSSRVHAGRWRRDDDAGGTSGPAARLPAQRAVAGI